VERSLRLHLVGTRKRSQENTSDDIAVLGAAHDNRLGYRCPGIAVASQREWCRDRADILDTVEGAADLNCDQL